jgi:hypothetical protein
MAAKIGILGEATTVTAATTTVYTVPSSKAAKVRIRFWCSLPNTSTFALIVNGLTVWADTAGAAEFAASAATIAAPGTAVVLNLQATNPFALTGATHVSALIPQDFYLSAADTVQYTVGVVDATAVRVQVEGVEDDA